MNEPKNKVRRQAKRSPKATEVEATTKPLIPADSFDIEAFAEEAVERHRIIFDHLAK